MPSEDHGLPEHGLSEPRRLPPISLLFGLGKAAWAFVLPAAFLVLTQGWLAAAFALFLLPALALTAASVVLKYISFSYQLEPDEMVIREGILRRNERHIPYSRIQNIDLVQNLFHRWLKVAVVKLETASGGKPEAVISVLQLDTVEEMRALVFQQKTARQKSGGETAAETETADTDDRSTLVDLSLAELAIFGAISNKGLVMVAAALGIASQIGFFDDPRWLIGAFQNEAQVPSWLASGLGLVAGVLLAVLGLLAIILALRLLSVLWAIIKYYAFRLDRLGDDLRAEYGLLTKVTATIPRHRIQLVTVNLTPLHRWFGRASVQVDTAGGGGGGGDSQQGAVQERQWLAPVIPRLDVLKLLRRVMPESRLEHFDWQPISQRAWRRLFRRWMAILVLLLAISFVPSGGWSLVAVFLLVPLAVIHSQLYVRRSGYALTPAAVLYRSGSWIRRVSIVPFGKIQVLRLRQTPFDRRNQMATVQVDTAGATIGGHRVKIDYLDTETAREVLKRLDLEAASTAFKW
ncbi:MAG: PH domain-containing protein [bacterium]|nr:PH domain-containing protein [bacterium]